MPDWLPEAREFCQRAGTEVYGWGPDTLTVKADSPERAERVASGLRPLGFKPIKDEDDAHASTLLLSRNPAATRKKHNGSRASFDLSKQPLIQRIVPIFEAALSLAFLWFSTTRPAPKSWLMGAVGSIFLAIFLWEGGRVWGWGLQMSPEELRVRRYFRWSAIPWAQIRAVEAKTKYARGAAFVTVTLTLASKSRLRVGTFGDSFASALRDRLREEIAQRQRKQN